MRKDKRIKVLGYTLVIFGAVCLARVPTTNSKYYKASDFYDGSYYMYNVGLRKLTDENIEAELPISSQDIKMPRSEITSTIPRNTIVDNPINAGATEEKYTYYLKANNDCLIKSIDNESLVDAEDANGKLEGSISFTGTSKKDFQIILSCPTKESFISSTKFLGVQVDIESTLTTEPSIDIDEEINEEGRFTYRKYSKSISISGEDSIKPNSVTISKNDSNTFKKYVTWLLQKLEDKNYEYSTSKDSIKKYIEEKIKESQGSNYNENELVTIYNSPEKIPKIEGINVKVEGENYTFSLDDNIVGYVNTYNSYKEYEKKIKSTFILHFNTEKIKDESKIEEIFEKYVELYFSDDESIISRIKEYVKIRGGINSVLSGKSSITGLSKVSNSQVSVSELDTLIFTVKLPTNTILYGNDLVSGGIAEHLKNEILYQEDVMNMQYISNSESDKYGDINKMSDIITYGLGYSTAENRESYLPYFLELEKYEAEAHIDRYFIYHYDRYDSILSTMPNRYLIIKVSKGTGEYDGYMELHVSDLDTALSDAAKEVFDFKLGSKVYINIDTDIAKANWDTSSAEQRKKYIDRMEEVKTKLQNKFSDRINVNEPYAVDSRIKGSNYMYYYYSECEIIEGLSETTTNTIEKAPESMDATGEVKAADENLKDASENVPLKTDSNVVNEKVTSTKDVLNKIDDSNVSDKQVSETDNSIDKNKVETVDESKDTNNKITSEGNPESSEMKETNEIKDAEDSTPYTISDDVR